MGEAEGVADGEYGEGAEGGDALEEGAGEVQQKKQS